MTAEQHDPGSCGCACHLTAGAKAGHRCVQRECTIEEGRLWQRNYVRGYQHGRADTLNPRKGPQADLLLDEIPAQLDYENGAQYVARHLDLAYRIAYTRAVAWYSGRAPASQGS